MQAIFSTNPIVWICNNPYPFLPMNQMSIDNTGFQKQINALSSNPTVDYYYYNVPLAKMTLILCSVLTVSIPQVLSSLINCFRKGRLSGHFEHHFYCQRWPGTGIRYLLLTELY